MGVMFKKSYGKVPFYFLFHNFYKFYGTHYIFICKLFTSAHGIYISKQVPKKFRFIYFFNIFTSAYNPKKLLVKLNKNSIRRGKSI